MAGPIVTCLGVELLHGLRHHVRGVVTQQLEAVRRAARDDLNGGVVFDRSREIAQFSVYADGHGVALEARADTARDG
jgi:hypothetical protein